MAVMFKRPETRWEALGQLLDILTGEQVNVLSAAEFLTGVTGGDDYRIVSVADLKKLRDNLTPAFEHDDQACLVKIDALIAGES